MEKTFNEKNWMWYRYDQAEEMNREANSVYESALMKWANETRESKTNVMNIDTTVQNQEFISGSLIYQQKMEEKNKNDLFHYFLTRDFLVTINFDSTVIKLIDEKTLLKKMESVNNPIEGFFVIIGEILNDNIRKIDGFEVRLNDLLWKVKKKNSINRLEEIYQLRHELLVWKNLMIPIKELEIGVVEVFGVEAAKEKEFKRTCKRIERGDTLVREYQQEIDTLVNFEEMVSQHRGNEIIKTLTVITTLFTPISAWAALWGMNFTYMPELDWKIGYPISLLIIAGSTAALYILLIKKGWTGDILKGKKKDFYFR